MTSRKIIIGLAIFVVIVVLSVGIKSILTSQNTTQKSSTTYQVEESGANLNEELTEGQLELLNSYTSTSNEISSLLETGTWIESGNQSRQLRFSRGLIYIGTVQADGSLNSNTQPFVLITSEKNVLQQADGSEALRYSGSVLTSSGGANFTLSNGFQSATNTRPWVLECTVLSDKSFVLSEENRDFAIQGDTAALSKAIRSEANAAILNAAVKSFCLKYFPLASEATWSNEYSINFITKTFKTTFTVKSTPTSTSKLSVTCPYDGSTFTQESVQIDVSTS